MPIDSVQEKLQALFVAYTKNLPHKIAELENEWAALLNDWDQQKIQDFHRNIHSLCGSAGTYGYIALGKAARQLEIYLKLLLNNSTISKEQQDDITYLLAQIKVSFTEITPVLYPAMNLSNNVIEKNTTVYFLDHNEKFINEIKNHVQEVGYHFIQLSDFSQLITAIKNNQWGALVINMDLLDDANIRYIEEMQKQIATSQPLICISSKGDILTRLKAVRMGSKIFLQQPLDAFFVARTLDQLCGIAVDEPYRILTIDDSPSLAEYFSLVLQEVGMKTHFITNPLQLFEAIEEFQPDLLLMDIYMPECSGLELAAVLRQNNQYTSLPIIFLSTEDDRTKQLTALNIGGDDFLTKPILPQHLIAAVKSRAKRAGILSSMMMRDSLTGLLNHTTILQRLNVELARAARQSTSLCFIMLDLDNFKSINDHYGHLVGDRVLKSLSNLLSSTLRKIDLTGRYGGEEFAIILPNTNLEQGIKVCNNLREKFSEISYKINGAEFHVTFSSGIASYPQITDAKRLISAADKALYTAKHNGRNQICY